MNAQPQLQASLEQLARAHGFTLEALAANRAGRIHPTQQSRGKSKGIGCAVFLFLLSGLLLVGGVGGAAFLYEDLRPPISQVDMNAVYALAIGGVLLSLFAFAGAIATVVWVVRRRGVYRAGALEVVEGPITRVHIRGSRGSGDTYGYDIGGRSFRFVPRQGWELIGHGTRYRVYSIAGDLLSLEPL